MRRAGRYSQRGAVIVTVCLMMFFLLGFMGLALDFSRAFVVKSELQTAMDSCALAAAQELDGASDSITRATSAGLTAGNLNRVHFQSANWSGKGQLTSGDLQFLDANYVTTTAPASAKYVRCAHTHTGMSMLLMSALGHFFNDDPTYPASRDVAAQAVATRASAQTTCPIPVALKPKVGGVAPDYGFTTGEWVTLLMGPGEATNGEIGWANLDGSNSASETEDEMNGYCGTAVGDTLGTPGVQASIVDAWNYRFGIYKNNVDPSVTHHRPDLSGYAYTATNWPAQFNAWSGTSGGSSPTADSFVNKRLAYASCADTGTQVRGGPNSCEGITGLSLNGFQKLAAPGAAATGGHRQWGTSRRVVLVPVIDGASKVIDYACMFMLQPLSIPMTSVKLEYRGNAGAPGSPCTTNGLPGGSAGPLVPALVR
jgi:Flp pilus assembly protein TadG